MTMLLVHLSDIHFQAPLCNTDMDFDKHFREQLVADLETKVNELRHRADAIVVSGDVAYKGVPDEYEAARKWLIRLANACGCPADKIFVVPGNHDVDREVIRSSVPIRNVQQAIIRAAEDRRENEFCAQFFHPETGPLLLASIRAYIDFAREFGCEFSSPEQLVWKSRRLDLDENTALQLYGLNSTLLSGAWVMDGHDENRGALYLSPFQTAMTPTRGVVNVIICHHPPDWLLDNDQVEDAINGRTSIQFFGHKHLQRVRRDSTFVRFSAGAVNPGRNERGWQPGYNIIQLHTTQEGPRRFLEIQAHLRVWQTSPDMFCPKYDSNGAVVFLHRIPLDPISRAETNVFSECVGPTRVQGTALLGRNVTPEALGISIMDNSIGDLAIRFWRLRSSQKREIVAKLALGEENDDQLSETERCGRVLARAAERGQLPRLDEEVALREKR